MLCHHNGPLRLRQLRCERAHKNLKLRAAQLRGLTYEALARLPVDVDPGMRLAARRGLSVAGGVEWA